MQAFFIISGFYMTLVINEKYSKLGGQWKARFYASRILRLFPAYIVVSLIALAIFHSNGVPNAFTDDNDLSPQARAVLVFLNLFIVGQDFWESLLSLSKQGNEIVAPIVSFFGETALNPIYVLIGQSWSLSIELLFYAIAPFIVLSKRRMAAFFIAFLAVRLFFAFNPDIFPNEPWRSRFFASNFPLFMLGGFGYWIYIHIQGWNHAKRIGKGALISLLFALVFSIWNKGGAFLMTGGEDYDTAELWVFYILFAAAVPLIFNFTKNFKVDRFIGELSYPLYLVHGLVIGWVTGTFINYSPSTRLLSVIAMSLVVSMAIQVLIDMPIDRVRRKVEKYEWSPGLVKRTIATCVVVPIAFLGYVGAIKADPVSKPIFVPYLIKSINNKNIVKYGDDYYIVPHGVPVDWRKDDLMSLPGMKRADDLESADEIASK